MTPKQKRLQKYSRSKIIVKIKKFVIGFLLIAGFLKLLSLGLQSL